MFLAEGYHEHEFWFPYYRFREEGADVIAAGMKRGMVQGEGNHGKDGLHAEISHTITQVSNMNFDALFLPGGIYNNCSLREYAPALSLIRKSIRNNIVIGAICHGQWLLVSADVIKGRRISCSGDMADDVRNAGATFARKCVKDGNIVTAEYFDYLPELMRLLIPAISAR